MAQAITLGGTAIKTPSEFEIEEYNLTKAGRVTSGKMTMEYIDAKSKFLLRWEVISGTDVATILNKIRTTSMFFTITYYDNGVQYSATVYVGAIRKKQYRTDGVWYWTDFGFDLIEQ